MICEKCEGTIYGPAVFVGDESFCEDCLLAGRPWGAGGADDLVREILEPLGEGCLAGLYETPLNPSPRPDDLL